jgi:hypothetical protein
MNAHATIHRQAPRVPPRPGSIATAASAHAAATPIARLVAALELATAAGHHMDEVITATKCGSNLMPQIYSGEAAALDLILVQHPQNMEDAVHLAAAGAVRIEYLIDAVPDRLVPTAEALASSFKNLLRFFAREGEKAVLERLQSSDGPFGIVLSDLCPMSGQNDAGTGADGRPHA